MAVILAKPCHLCGTTLRPIANRQTKAKTDVMGCEHCDQPHADRYVGRCPQCIQVAKTMPTWKA